MAIDAELSQSEQELLNRVSSYEFEQGNGIPRAALLAGRSKEESEAIGDSLRRLEEQQLVVLSAQPQRVSITARGVMASDQIARWEGLGGALLEYLQDRVRREPSQFERFTVSELVDAQVVEQGEVPALLRLVQLFRLSQGGSNEYCTVPSHLVDIQHLTTLQQVYDWLVETKRIPRYEPPAPPAPSVEADADVLRRHLNATERKSVHILVQELGFTADRMNAAIRQLNQQGDVGMNPAHPEERFAARELWLRTNEPQAAGPRDTFEGARTREIHPSARRWLDLGLLAVTGSALVLFGLWYWRMNILTMSLPQYHWLLGLVAVIALLVHHKRRVLALLGLRHFFSYPPVWFAALLGLTSLFALVGNVSGIAHDLLVLDEAQVFRTVASCCGLAVIGAAILGTVQFRPRPFNVRQKAKLRREIISDFRAPELFAWLADDAPVTLGQGDLFGHSEIARRIAKRCYDLDFPSQAVVGHFGAGKTTLRHLVRESLDSDRARSPVKLVCVELWPYEDVKAAVQGVIETLIEAVGAEVNVLAIQGMPGKYVAAMSSAGRIGQMLAHLQGVPANPFDALSKIDEVARAIGFRFVVWVEDLERFASTDTGGDQQADADRLNPIRALLHGLDRQRNIKVITATTSLQMRFDIEKIARYVERIPDLPEYAVAQVLANVRRTLRNEAEVIDPAESTTRERLDDLGNRERIQARRLFGASAHSVADALPMLCATPRTLKQGLRRVIETWRAMPGELDFDDLLAMRILREAEPDAFALIEKHVSTLRDSVNLRGTKQELRAAWEHDLDDLQRRKGLRPVNALRAIVNFVFPLEGARDKPQGFAQTFATDYWERFNSGIDELDEPERDQPILRRLSKAVPADVLDLLETHPDKVEQFSRLLPSPDLLGYLVPMLRRWVRTDPTTWHTDTPPGFLALWRLWLRRAEQGELPPQAAFDEIRRGIDEVVPQSLRVGLLLEKYFVGGVDQDVNRILPDRNHAQGSSVHILAAKAYLRNKIIEHFEPSPGAIVAFVAGAKAPSLSWLCWGLDRVRAEDTLGVPFPEWERLAKILVEASRLEAALLPYLAWLVVKESTKFGRRDEFFAQYAFDSERAKNLFGSEDTILDLFERVSGHPGSEDSPQAAVALAVQERRAQRQKRSAQRIAASLEVSDE